MDDQLIQAAGTERLCTDSTTESHAPFDDYSLASKMFVSWLCLKQHLVGLYPLPYELRDMILRHIPSIYMHEHGIRRKDLSLPDKWYMRSTFELSRPIRPFNFGNFFVQRGGLCIKITGASVILHQTKPLFNSCARYYYFFNGDVDKEIFGHWRQFEELLQPALEHLETHYIPLARWLHAHWLEL